MNILTAMLAVALVVPADQIESEKYAAQELCEYVQKVTGEKLEVVSEDKAPSTGAIHLGATAFAKNAIKDLDKFGKEEWTVKSADGSLVLAGGRPRGVLYAVYHYLEDILGVAWLSPIAEYIPENGKLVMDNLSLRGKPAMPYRDIYVVPGNDGNRFLARNRGNRRGAKYGCGRLYGGSSDNHTMYSNLGGPDEIRRLFKEHPEWFPIIKGKRYCHVERANSASQSQLCLTNPELRKYWAEKLRERIRADRVAAQKEGVPAPMFYAVDPNDCFDGFCECENCQAIAKREESNAGLMLDFANYMAETLEDELGESRIQMMALHSSEKPPKYMKARHNVTIRTCDTTSNVVVPWTHENNKPHLDNVLEWAKHTDALAMWDYQINFGATSATCQPTPTERTFASDLRTLRDAHGAGVFFEHEAPVACDMRDLKVWLEFKLIENPDLDPAALVRRFTDLYYGPKAGEVIRRYRRLLGGAATSAKAWVSWFPSVANYNFITALVAIDAYRLRREALAAVEGDAEKTARVNHAFMSLDRNYLVTSIAKRRYLEFNKPELLSELEDPAEVAKRYRAVFEYETKARGYSDLGGLEKFMVFIDKMRDLPVPSEFKDVPKDALLLIPTTFAGTWYNGLKFVDDPESPAKRVLTYNLGLVKKNPHEYYPQSAYSWPFVAQLLPTMDGHLKRTISDYPAEQPKGYHWYKAFSDAKLMPDSYLHLFAGARVPLVGAVCDNSELGQLYDIYFSMKIEGGDVFKSKLPDWTVVYYLDQIAVVRKTKNSNKKGQ